MARRVAVIGAGMTRFVRRARETGKELSWQAARAALATAQITLDQVDAVCCVTAPDAFDGVHRKGEYLADGCGAVGKPFIRTYVGGGSGVFGGIQAWYTVSSGDADVVLIVAEEKMSSCQPHPQGAFLTIFDHILERPLGPNLLWIFALEMQRYMTVHGLDKRDIAAVAVKNKRNAADHPAALLGQRDLTVDDVLASEVLAWPVQRLDVSPISDGAVALVLAAEDVAVRRTDRPVWIQGVGWNLDTAYWTNRDLVYPEYVENAARMAYGMAGVKEPRKEIHVVEPYDPFDYKELHHLEGLLLFDRGKAPEAARDGVLDRDGDLPSCPSGGLLGVGNPIAAAGLMKLAELFWQLRGEAGARQIPGTPERGLAQAWGDLMQVGTVVVMGTDGPPRTAAREAPPEVERGSGSGAGTPPPDPAGTGLSEAEFRQETGAIDDAIDARYAWDAGRAIGGFLAGLRDGRLLGRECSGCGRVLVPPRMFCERCFRPTDRWIDVPPIGTVQTFSICHVSWDMQPLERPQLPAVIRFDGTEDGGLLHLLGDVDPEDVHVGMHVEAVWRLPEDRTGSILDVAHFRPNPEPPTTAPTPVPDRGGEVRTWPGQLPVRHRYTPGVGGMAFAEALRGRGVLLGSRCERCAITYAPARAFCERCFGPLDPGVEVGPAGTLVSWTVAHRGTEGEPLETPTTYGLIRLDGADTVLLHELTDVAEPRAGMMVRAILRPADERTGTIRDVLGFGPG